MKIGLCLSQTQTQEQNQVLMQWTMINSARLLSTPDEVISQVINSISINPDSTENVLKERPSENDTSTKVKTLYESFTNTELSPLERRGGIILYPDIRALEQGLSEQRVVVTPDATYIGRLNQKPEIVFSDHLRSQAPILALQINPKTHPKTATLVQQIKRFDKWKREKLRETYTIIGEEQREFFERLNKTKLNKFNQEDLANRLNICQATISRLLKNRYIDARSVEGTSTITPTRDLLVTVDGVRKYAILPRLNEILADEFEHGKAYSDQRISDALPGIARRTVTKYRTESEIPARKERTKSYETGERQKPFQFK